MLVIVVIVFEKTQNQTIKRSLIKFVNVDGFLFSILSYSRLYLMLKNCILQYHRFADVTYRLHYIIAKRNFAPFYPFKAFITYLSIVFTTSERLYS